VPAPHKRHWELAGIPVPVQYEPAVVSWHVAAVTAPDAVENVPALQVVHTALLVAPVSVEYMPAEHKEQALRPARAV
jgi:hypothetical protein